MRLDSHLDFFDSLRIWGLVNCRSWILTWIKTPRWMDKMITVATYVPTIWPTGDKVAEACSVSGLVLGSVGLTHPSSACSHPLTWGTNKATSCQPTGLLCALDEPLALSESRVAYLQTGGS